MTSPERPTLSVAPIGVIRTPFPDRSSAPRQPALARGVQGTIQLYPDGRYEHALADLETFSHVWVLFWFHLNDSWRAKVLPPRSDVRRGVFATRSPHRPNPLGMSVMRLDRIEGTTLHVLDVDLIDETPILDIKPYVPYTDAVPEASHGWLDADPDVTAARAPVFDPKATFAVRFSEAVTAELAYLRDTHSVDLGPRIAEVLVLGPSPHPYRRIKKDGDDYVLAVREWRVRFRADAESVDVLAVYSGYRPSELFGSDDPKLAVHRAFAERFGVDGASSR